MLTLFERTNNQDADTVANASLEIGNALYQVALRGSARIRTSQFGWDRWSTHSIDENPIANMDLAEKYYMQAMNRSPNKEVQAKACFMAAKAEQNRFYNTRKRDENDIHPGKYYRLMKTTYSDTKYFQEVIHECGYFRTWIQK